MLVVILSINVVTRRLQCAGTSRYPAQDSRPSGSLLLSRKALSSSASCRFIGARPGPRGGYRVSGIPTAISESLFRAF
jgi:hypothetical protein